MRRLLLLSAAFGYLVLLIEAIRAAVAWWRGDLVQPAWDDIVLMGLLPVLAWIWWRYLSPFGRDCPKCVLPPQDGRDSRG